MTLARFLTRVSTPLVWLLWKLGVHGRAEWNLCVGAWDRHAFDARWHFEHFGDPIASLPEYVVLGGIQYDTHVHEGLVVFATDAFFARRIEFERDPNDPLADIWYVRVNRPTPASHLVQSYAWVRGVFGGSFERRGAA
jgi:hypothetical protein